MIVICRRSTTATVGYGRRFSMSTIPPLPDLVAQASTNAVLMGFAMSCDDDVGRLLAVLAAAVPPDGRILELGTGAGVGTAWLVHGLGVRTDVKIITVEIDQVTASAATEAPWPGYVSLIVGDAVEIARSSGLFDLVFADAPGGKWDGLDVTIAALRPGGHLLVDDMSPAAFVDSKHELKTAEVRARILGDPSLASVELAWSTGLILSTRHRTKGA